MKLTWLLNAYGVVTWLNYRFFVICVIGSVMISEIFWVLKLEWGVIYILLEGVHLSSTRRFAACVENGSCWTSHKMDDQWIKKMSSCRTLQCIPCGNDTKMTHKWFCKHRPIKHDNENYLWSNTTIQFNGGIFAGCFFFPGKILLVLGLFL